MEASDWNNLIVASNEAVMQWYSLVTQKPLPTQVNTTLPGGGTVRIGAPSTSSLLVIGLIALVAIMLLKD